MLLILKEDAADAYEMIKTDVTTAFNTEKLSALEPDLNGILTALGIVQADTVETLPRSPEFASF